MAANTRVHRQKFKNTDAAPKARLSAMNTAVAGNELKVLLRFGRARKRHYTGGNQRREMVGGGL